MSENHSFIAKNIDVLFSFDGRERYARPVRLSWNGDDYELGGVQFWYAEHRGGTLVHHYTLSDTAHEYVFELALETENLTWQLVKATELHEARTLAAAATEVADYPTHISFNNLVGALS